jgi:hypothetical protein
MWVIRIAKRGRHVTAQRIIGQNKITVRCAQKGSKFPSAQTPEHIFLFD